MNEQELKVGDLLWYVEHSDPTRPSMSPVPFGLGMITKVSEIFPTTAFFDHDHDKSKSNFCVYRITWLNSNQDDDTDDCGPYLKRDIIKHRNMFIEYRAKLGL